MTRINVVPPSELCRQHLVAEYRELPRIFTLARNALDRGEKPDDKRNPVSYTLGTGHCRFFYSRLGWLHDRHQQLVNEMLNRGYQPTIFLDPVDMPSNWMKPWKPSAADLDINRQRILARMPKS